MSPEVELRTRQSWLAVIWDVSDHHAPVKVVEAIGSSTVAAMSNVLREGEVVQVSLC